VRENFDRLGASSPRAGASPGFPPGYNQLNNITSGLQGSELIILAARPAVGKTALAPQHRRKRGRAR